MDKGEITAPVTAAHATFQLEILLIHFSLVTNAKYRLAESVAACYEIPKGFLFGTEGYEATGR